MTTGLSSIFNRRTSMTTGIVFAISFSSFVSRTIIPKATAFAPLLLLQPSLLQQKYSFSSTKSYTQQQQRTFTPFPTSKTTSTSTSTANMSSSSNNSGAGPRQLMIEERLSASSLLAPIHYLDVQNKSHGQHSDESHFKVVIVSDQFEGTRLVGRHRLINKACSEEDGTLGFHSLEIGAAKTIEEWNKNSSIKESPKCRGGDGRGMKN
mmetsp:Transcript_27501/g.30772  ORF Transcript_27501/g.30772 Transcript_27501/m.30772 type:complete len:208 (+) Transcript_27501:71-694(+)